MIRIVFGMYDNICLDMRFMASDDIDGWCGAWK